MPYTSKGKCVYKKDTGEKVGCTKGSVKKYLGALHANVKNEVSGSESNEVVFSKPMKISDLIKRMFDIKRKHGDLPVNLSEDEGYEFVNGVALINSESPQEGVVISTRMYELSKITELRKIIKKAVQEVLNESDLTKYIYL